MNYNNKKMTEKQIININRFLSNMLAFNWNVKREKFTERLIIEKSSFPTCGETF